MIDGDVMVPITFDALVRAVKAAQPVPAWYESEPFKTLVAVVIGALLGLSASWWLKRFDIRARADALKIAFHGEIGALRSALSADAKTIEATIDASMKATGPPLYTDIQYSRNIFESSAAHLGDIRNPILIRQLAGFYTLLRRLEDLGRTITRQRSSDNDKRFAAGLASARYMATLIDVRLRGETSRLKVASFKMRFGEADEADQRLAIGLIKRYGTTVDLRVVDNAPGRHE